MRTIKSERLKKLEAELNDLQQWLKLGLVPKKDIDKHKEEIESILGKIEEEKERLQFLKESGEAEEYVAPKRNPTRAGYTDMPTGLDMDMGETGGLTETGFDMESDNTESSIIEEREEVEEEGGGSTETQDEETDFFSERRNRWGKGIVDPDADEW